MTPRTSFVYRYTEPSGELIYIGRTKDPATRAKRHERDAVWWHPDLLLRLVGPMPEAVAIRVERDQIEALRPSANIAGNPDAKPEPTCPPELLARGKALAIKAAGSQQKLADALGISRPAVALWPAVPVERCPMIEVLYGVPVERLRPDVFTGVWSALRAADRLLDEIQSTATEAGQQAGRGVS